MQQRTSETALDQLLKQKTIKKDPIQLRPAGPGCGLRTLAQLERAI
jgi:hypothetical protein